MRLAEYTNHHISDLFWREQVCMSTRLKDAACQAVRGVPELDTISDDVLVVQVQHASSLESPECLQQSLSESICAVGAVGISYSPQCAGEKLIQQRIVINNAIASVYGLRSSNWLELAQASIGKEPVIILDVVVPFCAEQLTSIGQRVERLLSQQSPLDMFNLDNGMRLESSSAVRRVGDKVEPSAVDLLFVKDESVARITKLRHDRWLDLVCRTTVGHVDSMWLHRSKPLRMTSDNLGVKSPTRHPEVPARPRELVRRTGSRIWVVTVPATGLQGLSMVVELVRGGEGAPFRPGRPWADRPGRPAPGRGVLHV